MEIQNSTIQKKTISRVKLINWHYLENETVAINGSTLLTGDNAVGKSTILDAIQMVLTTNTKKFNEAANQKSKRTLKGYVRCKVGNIGEEYLRKNTVISGVAVEIYEEKGDRYFTLGAHITSPDEESAVIVKWYLEECRLESFTFIKDNKPVSADAFKVNGKTVKFIDQKNAAKDRFKRRLGNLDDKFFDIVPKSLAFKPMDNVKDFINKFVLSESNIDVASLRENIETLSELELTLERSQKQYNQIENILEVYDRIEKKNYDIVVNDILLGIAGYDAIKENISNKQKDIGLKKLSLESDREQLNILQKQLSNIDENIIDINVALQANSANNMADNLKRKIDEINSDIKDKKDDIEKLGNEISKLSLYCKYLQTLDYHLFTKDELESFRSDKLVNEKNQLVLKFEEFQNNEFEKIVQTSARLSVNMDALSNELSELQEKLDKLSKKVLSFPENTTKLKEAIEKEFEKRHINSKVYILAELLEITKPKWTDAVEGYFNKQKFYLIVDPEYYDIALSVYDKKREYIHSAGIINTKRLPLDDNISEKSLAFVVKSENRYARAYANYILGRVVRCDNVSELEKYDIAITKECMLYQGYVVRHINPANYRDPYIGQNAYMTQISNTRKAIEEKSAARKELRDKLSIYKDLIQASNNIELYILKQCLSAPNNLKELKQQYIETKAEYDRASNDPTLIELKLQLDKKIDEKKKVVEEENSITEEISRLAVNIENLETEVSSLIEEGKEKEKELQIKQDENIAGYKEASDKYAVNRKTKSAKTIADNFAPQKTQFENDRNRFIDEIKQYQYRFNQEFTEDFSIGLAGISEYREAAYKLKSIDIIRYEENLRKAKDECEEIFRSDFLSKMKELIENARFEFRSLNKALEGIYYGDDSYKFKITYDKKKEGLYKMITSDNNQDGINLWTATFEEEYKEEMKDLFDKLMTKDDNGKKVVEEYTDYRTYLDYDIEIHKKDGTVQKFSDIYGEKSGSETQVPYYVAIAASFYQLYRYGNSIRVMLLDEAFDKMDDDRIGSMLDFFNSLGLQVIMATPPAKMEVIAEKIDTVLAVIRVGEMAIVEEYDL